MPPHGRVICAACGVALMGAAVVHDCLAAIHQDGRPRQAVIFTLTHAHGSHEDRPAETEGTLDIYARQVTAGATTSGDAPPGNNHRQQQEIVAQWWNRQEHGVWQAAKLRVNNFNQSGMDSTSHPTGRKPL